MKIKQREDKPEWKDAYVLNIWLTLGNHHEIRVKPEIKDYKVSMAHITTEIKDLYGGMTMMMG